jgi:hypothetical protein
MTGLPHFVQGTVESGGRSPGMKTFASHAGQVTITNGFLFWPSVTVQIFGCLFG